MLTQEQLEQRKKGITATDAVAILGISPWKTALDVYLEKTDALKPWSKSSTAMELGNVVEDYLVRKLIEYFELDIFDNKLNTTLADEWKLATPDVYSTGQYVGEVKFVGSSKMTDWGDNPPDYVRAQVVWQMIVADVPVGYICAALGGTDVRFYEVKAGDAERTAMVELCEQFWKDRVCQNRPPAATTLDEARKLILSFYPRADGPSRLANDQEIRYANEYISISKEIKELEERKEKCRLRLMNEMGETSKIYHDHFTVQSSTRKTTSWKEICKEVGVSKNIIEAFTKESERFITIKEK